ncbi:uncharacterized protein LOC121407545 [Lytechinus variegatus]|uniref:uncharacterized protein LOC121407545 n=1 Tax=Lytechinus variegatus TaxID=7654 RepID=UPI001BB1467F|nr:uncharacterized protein LOC121407545 [Lytechinus variegatus]
MSVAGGYKDLLKPKKKYKKLSRKDKLDNARERVVRKLGEEKIEEIVNTFSKADGTANKARADGMILTMLAQGLSQIEVISILPVGGYRVSRLSRFDPEEEEGKTRKIPWHAATDEDKEAIKKQIDSWDIEPGYPCAHRKPLEYIEAGKEWQALYAEYKEERCMSGNRVLSLVRWREYVRAFRPRLRLKHATTDLCNCCYKIDLELKDPAISDERKAELKLQKETHLEDAITQRRAMNKAVAQYQKAWAPNDHAVEEVLSLVIDPDEPGNEDTNQPEIPAEIDEGDASSEANGHPSSITTNTNPNDQASTTKDEARKIVVLCEDYGQAIALPSYKLSRPNVDYFNSDLHIQMFNICDVTQKKNAILLYDERTAGKDGNATCSLRWYYHCKFLQNLLQKGISPPTMAIKVLDNCVGQNKSQCTLMFDCLLSLLLYDRVANFYLLPGHSHMKPDQVVSSCKRALNKKNLYIPDQVVDAFNTVSGMHAEFFIPEKKVFRDWDRLLKKYLKPLPTGFTENYCFEVANGAVVYKPLVSSPDEDGLEHIFCTNVAATRKAILADVLGLPSTAELADIVSRVPKLPVLEERPVTKSKEKSISKKLSCIPAQYRAYYPGANVSQDSNDPIDTEQEAPPVTRKKPVGRPKKSSSVESTGGVQKSIVRFMIASEH